MSADDIMPGLIREMDNMMKVREQEAREALTAQHGKVWNTAELVAEYEVKAFAAPFVLVTRKSDGMTGTLEFTHLPRFYFDFREDK